MPHLVGFKINGEVAPSVTEIISLISKPYLDQWKRRVGFEEADRVMNTAAELGREVHDMVDEFLKQGSLSTCSRSEKAQQLFKAWFEWWQRGEYKLVASEVHLVSQKYKVHGSTDAILEANIS